MKRVAVAVLLLAFSMLACGCVASMPSASPTPNSTWIGTYRYTLRELKTEETYVLELLATGVARMREERWHIRIPELLATTSVGTWAVRDHIVQLRLRREGYGEAHATQVGLRNPAGQIGLFFWISNSMRRWDDGNWRTDADAGRDITVDDPGVEPTDTSGEEWWRWAYRALNLKLARDPVTWLSRVPIGLDVADDD